MKTKFICLLIILVCICNVALAGNVTTPTNLEFEPADIEPVATPEPIILPPAPIVNIYWDARPLMYEGEDVHIYSEVINGEFWELHYQWLYSEDDTEWLPIPGANEPIYVFQVTKEALSHSYILEITYRLRED